ncbi:chemotaxis protein CheB [Rhodobaculum claviforme]|uniref:chemotaxis protein CheB n=1 Tax=Rhodobaculum claviforme TaxID=1549854 RepID=UPI001912F4C3
MTAPAPSAPEGAVRAILCLGASTGGITVLDRILPELPADCPPTLVVQHIIGRFTEGLVRRLDGLCRARVVEAGDGMRLRRGTIYFAPGAEAHLQIDPAGLTCRLLEGAPRSGHRPSVDVLFHSAARLRRPVGAALLSGMGSDGAAGLRAIRDAGGFTIAQDEASCTVYGMPRAAVALGGAMVSLPPARIAEALLAFATQGAPASRAP